MSGGLGARVLLCVVAAFALGGVATPASAQDSTPPIECVFRATRADNSLTVRGVTTPNTQVVVLANGIEIARPTSGKDGSFEVVARPAPKGHISVGPVRGYPLTSCLEVRAPVARRPLGPLAGEGGAVPLARTGSSDSIPLALLGAALVAVGLVVVVGARRRAGVRGRT